VLAALMESKDGANLPQINGLFFPRVWSEVGAGSREEGRQELRSSASVPIQLERKRLYAMLLPLTAP